MTPVEQFIADMRWIKMAYNALDQGAGSQTLAQRRAGYLLDRARGEINNLLDHWNNDDPGTNPEVRECTSGAAGANCEEFFVTAPRQLSCCTCASVASLGGAA